MSNVHQQVSGHGGAASVIQSAVSGLGQRLRGPGGLYNLGNAIGFFGGMAASLVNIPAEDFGMSAALAAGTDFVVGSPPATALTLATLIFFWSGEEYHRAFRNGVPPDEAKIRAGDLSSAVGAVLLAFAFLALGNLVLALTAGVMHATGKLGSAWAASRAIEQPGYSFRYSTLCREMVLLSRIPATAMAIKGLMADQAAGATASSHIVSGVLLACCLVWAIADIQLLPAQSLLSPRRWWPAAGKA